MSDRTNGVTRRHRCQLRKGTHTHTDGNSRSPAAFLGADLRHVWQRLEEHGISCRRYTSRTIFCTLPLLVDRTYTLLDMFWAKGSAPAVRLRLAILLARRCNKIYVTICAARLSVAACLPHEVLKHGWLIAQQDPIASRGAAWARLSSAVTHPLGRAILLW